MRPIHLFILLLFIICVQAEEINYLKVEIKVEQSGELLIAEKIVYDFGKENKYGIN